MARRCVVCLLGGVTGFLAFSSSLGLEVIDPRAYDWLLRDDWRIHFLGWHLFRAGPWELPLGATPLLRAPVGSSVGLTDSIPILAALFAEGEAVGVLDYTRHRLAGKSHDQARQAVFQTISALVGQ